MIIRIADIIMIVFALLLAWQFYRAQKDPTFSFNLFDLLMDGNRVSKTSFAFMLTLAVTSWIIIRLSIDGKLTEGFFTSYCAAWVAPLVAKLFSPPPASGTTTTVSQSTVQTVANDTEIEK